MKLLAFRRDSARHAMCREAYYSDRFPGLRMTQAFGSNPNAKMAQRMNEAAKAKKKGRR